MSATLSEKTGKWENLTQGHLDRELGVLQKRFPKVDQVRLEGVLRDNGGHMGRTMKEIFKTFEGVEEQKKVFYKKYPGAFGCKAEKTFEDGSTGLVYGWNLHFDPRFVSNTLTKVVKGHDGEDVELQEVSCSILIHSYDKEEHYPNHDYFSKIANNGDSPYREGEWGTDPNERYDEDHPSNPEKLIPTRREIESLVVNFRTPLLGKIPFIDTDNDCKRGIYHGVNVQNPNGKKKKLPEGWIRGVADEYNGLYTYNQQGKMSQWKHPLD